MTLKLGIHWFRQDLRLSHNPSLIALSKKVDKIIPIYIVDPNQRIGSVSKWWLEQSLKNLSDNIKLENINRYLYIESNMNNKNNKNDNNLLDNGCNINELNNKIINMNNEIIKLIKEITNSINKL